MKFLRDQIRASPIHARAVPYVVILLLTFVQDGFAGPARYWLYLVKMLVGIWCIWEMRSLVPEIRWAFSWEAVVAGVLVLVIWVGLDPYNPPNNLIFKQGTPWNPFKTFEGNPAAAWFFFAVRTLGSSLIVPPLEEVFWRSFLYRYLVKINFEEMPFNRMHWLSFVITSTLFGLEHFQWLAGILCGMIYQFLVIRKNRLGDAILAHAITNFLLSIWVLWKGAWSFW